MSKPGIVTDRTDCACGARVIRTGRLVLGWDPSPFGTIAARHEASGAWLARRLSQGEQPVAGVEKRYAEHECEPAEVPAARLLPRDGPPGVTPGGA